MIKRIIRISVCAFFCLALNFQIKAQAPGTTFQKLSSIPLQSPQAASFSKYVEFPVSYYTGLVQISLPVYEIHTGDISVPITLSYHGGGIKLQEEASWVGLGWTLNVGGVISHDIKGEDDEYRAGPNNKYYPTPADTLYNKDYDAISLRPCNTSPDPIYFLDHSRLPDCQHLDDELALGAAPVDTEKDLYLYNFGSYSGKFFNSGSYYVDISRNNIVFGQTAGGFSAVTPDGFTYSFDKKETATSATHIITTAYYLTQIKSPAGKTVNFQYKTLKDLYVENGFNWYPYTGIDRVRSGAEEYVPQMPGLSEQYGIAQYNSGQSSQNPNSETGYKKFTSQNNLCTPYLDKIIFDNGYVSFSKSGRDDLYGVRLDAINMYRSDNSLVKTIPFSYGYFFSTGGDDLFDPLKGNVQIFYPTQFRQNRLKLLSVKIDDCPHSFEYYEGDDYTTLPCKTSYAQDYWGYYNGRNGVGKSLIPNYSNYNLQIDVPRVLDGWRDGTDRNPSSQFGNAASLKKINYPTGGNTEFVYETNTFDNQFAVQKEGEHQVTEGGYSTGGTQRFYFVLSTPKYLDISGGLHCNDMVENWNGGAYNCACLCSNPPNQNILYAMIEKIDNSHTIIAHYPQWEFDISKDPVRNANGWIDLKGQYFEAGMYMITVNYPVNHTPAGSLTGGRRAELYVSYKEDATNYLNAYGYGVGTRVKSIKHFDPVTQQTLTRNFTYQGGKLMHFPVFYWTTLMHYDDASFTGGAEYQLHYLYSSPAIPYSFSANGSFIGYDKVTETINDGSIGRTEYYYANTPDKFIRSANAGGNIGSAGPIAEYIPGVPTTGALDNGFLKQIDVYDNNNNLLKRTISEPALAMANTYWQFKYRSNNSGGGYFANLYLKMCFYPVQAGKLVTSKTTETEYLNGIAHTALKEYQYNVRGFLSEDKFTASDRSPVTINYAYASDYTGVNTGWINDLKHKNIIGVPLEVFTKRNGLVTGGSFTTYLNNNDKITPYQVYKIETRAAQNIVSTVPNGTVPSQLKLVGTLYYDNNGNLKQAQAENNIFSSYIWGYNNSLPVAQAVNAQQKDIFYASFEDGDGSSSDGDCKTGKKSWMGTSAFSKTLSGLSPTDYTLSYWQKNGGSWSLQKQSVSSSQIVNGNYTISLNGQIDEVKFYPKNAQMSTFTYDPLVGMISQGDINDRISSFEYDSRNRLLHVWDFNGKLLKKYEYFCNASVIPGNITANWQPTGRTRTVTLPCYLNGSYTVEQPQKEIQDINPYSAGYGTTSWATDGAWTSLASWQVVSTICEVNSNGYNTGNQIVTRKDMNPCSTTYGQLQTTLVSNATACPAPRACDASCGGSDPSTKCINGVCETGHWVMLSTQQYYDSSGNPVCVAFMGYLFSDGSTRTAGSSVVGTTCAQ